jgi:phage baseplate assembly protein W
MSAPEIASPWALDASGRTARAETADHVRSLIEIVLFTAPGERVNRPTFGSGVLQAVFAPNSDEVAATLQVLAQSSLQQFLGDLIEIEAVAIETLEASLKVTVQYVLRRTQERRVAQLVREA